MRKLLRHPYIVIGAILAITVFFALQLQGISIENTSRLYMPHESESYKTLLDTEDTFGSMLGLGISLETKEESIITPENIAIIKKITEQIETVDNVEDIDSLSNIDFIYGAEGSLVAGSLLGDDYTGANNDIKAIKQKIIDWQEMYNHVILSDDGRATQIMIQLSPKDEGGFPLSSVEQTKVLYNVKEITEEAIKGSDIEVRYYGDPVMSDNSRTFVLSDLTVLVPLVILVVLLSLYFSFHTAAGTFLPLITVGISTIWSCGLMVMLGFTFTIISSVIPVCLIACGSAYGIHVMTHYYIALDKAEFPLTKEKHLDIIASALKDVWVAVLLAAITTIAGFISNVTSPMEPLRSFSIFSAYGVAVSLFLSILFIPAMLYIIPTSKIQKPSERKNKRAQRFKERVARQMKRYGGRSDVKIGGDTMYALYHFFAGTRPRLALLIIAILCFSAAGFKKMIVDTALVNYFPPDSKFREDLAYIDKNMAGSNSLYLVVSGKEKGDMTRPEILKTLDNMQHYLESHHDNIGKIVSFTTFLKRMNQVMHAPDLTAQVTGQTDQYGEKSIAEEEESGFDFGGFDFVDDDANSQNAADETGGFDFGDFDFGNSTTFQDATDDTSGIGGESDYIDPNIAYSQILNSQASVNQILYMLRSAYSAAGGKQASIEQIFWELARELNFNGLDYYEIPYDTSKYPAQTREELSDLVSQYLLLLSSDDMAHFTDDMTNPRSVRTQVELRSHSTTETNKIIQDAKAYAAKYFPEGYTLQITGNAELDNTMTELVIKSQMISIILSLVMVFIIIAISFKSAFAGLIGAVPLALTIVLNFMVMGFADIHLDLFTSIISSIAIGVGIDYTIHFMETYKSMRTQNDDLEYDTQQTFVTSGKGIITNAIAVGLGFLVLLLSKFIILRYVGILVAIVMFSSSSLALTVMPGILNTFDPRFMHGAKEQKKQTYI